jgi:hypothetical protein
MLSILVQGQQKGTRGPIPRRKEMNAMRRKRELWVTAAQRLVCESTKYVDCPECGTPALQVRDVEYGWGASRGIERYMVCSHCQAYHSVNLRRAGPLVGPALMAAE